MHSCVQLLYIILCATVVCRCICNLSELFYFQITTWELSSNGSANVTCRNFIFIVSNSASQLTRMLHLLAYIDLLNENVVSGMTLVCTRGLYESFL